MLNILLVDDEPDLRASVGQVLREEGHAVDVAPDGEAAMARLASQQFHLVVSDVRLPKVDGLTLLRRIRRDFPATEVLLMTAYGSEVRVQAAKFAAQERRENGGRPVQ